MRTSRLLVLVLGLALGALPATSFAEALPPVYFNHVTIFIPAAAYDALRQSSFLRNEFSGFQEHTVQRDGGKWSYTGIFIFGQHTYLEFFKAGPDQPRYGTTIAGQVVFNMWIDDRAQLPRFKERLAAEQLAHPAHRHDSRRTESANVRHSRIQRRPGRRLRTRHAR
jgi:hypothetical protein